MKKLTIDKSSLSYQFLDMYDAFKHNLTKSDWIRDELKISNSCDYLAKLIWASIGTLMWLAAAFIVAFTLMFDSVLFYICASIVPEFDLRAIITMFNAISPSVVFEFTFIVYLSVLIVVAMLSITVLLFAVWYYVKKTEIIGIYRKPKVPKEPSVFMEMVKAKYNKICIPVEIVDSNK